MDSPRTQAEKLWIASLLASEVLPKGTTVHLGTAFSSEVLQHLAQLSGVSVGSTLYVGEEIAGIKGPFVIEHVWMSVGRVQVQAQGERPATPDDHALSAHFNRQGRPANAEEISAALGGSDAD